jgi:methyltransferase
VTPDWLGWPQIAALMVLAQRGLEELHSQRNTRRLLAEGAVEAGADYYPVVAITHLAWIASVFFLIPASAPIVWPMLVLFMVLQVVRYWIIGTLGRYWTHRIITLPSAPIVKAGPYGFVKHPNYAVTIAETLLLPWAFGAWALGLIMVAIWTAVLRYKIQLEDEALAARRAA